MIVIYISHVGYESNYFQDIFDDLERLVMGTYVKFLKVIIRGDFNLNLNDGVRDRVLQDLCS